MKKTCNGCKAFGGLIENHCALGYKIELQKFDVVFVVGAKPLEECPKPKTTSELMKYMK